MRYYGDEFKESDILTNVQLSDISDAEDCKDRILELLNIKITPETMYIYFMELCRLARRYNELAD